MKTKLTLLYIAITLSININTATFAQAVNVQDSLALVDLYNSTNGPHWYHNENWLTGPVKTWYGIQYISTIYNTRVVIDLRSNNLKGNIPSSIGNLANLYQLFLNDNQLNGNIPSSLSNLSHLGYLYLHNNLLSGSIPASLGNLTHLQYLALSNNELSDSIPSSLGNLTGLFELDLHNNQLSGNIPSSLGNLTNLQYLPLDHNQLSGSIPSSLGNLPHLGDLYLNNNQLSGNIPSSLGDLPQLGALYLNNNQLSGNIPSALSNAIYLYDLDLADNQLSGSIPSSLGDLVYLHHLNLAHNQLNGAIPATLGNLINIDALDVSFNRFTYDGMELVAQKFSSAVYAPQGIIEVHKTNNTFYVSVGGTPLNNTFYWYKDGALDTTIVADSTYTPTTIGNYDVAVTNEVAIQLTLYSKGSLILPSSDSLALVDLYRSTNGLNWKHHDNWLTGPISTWYGIKVIGTRVTSIDLPNNNLIGHIPSSLGNLTNLQTLKLGSNQLSDTIPSSLGTLTNLEDLLLDHNQLSGNIPSSLGTLTNFYQLNLAYNQLNGSIPASLGNLSRLGWLYLDHNLLSGSIPASLGNLTGLYQLYLSYNELSGSIPSSLGDISYTLGWLYLDHNQLSGGIPSSLGNLTGLGWLYLDHNQLSGNIPSLLSNLTNLRVLLLDDNQLGGSIPTSLNNLPELYWLDISYNRFTYDGMELIVQKYHNYSTFHYAPQALIPLYKTNNTLYVSVGGTPSNNTFYWYKDGVLDATIIADSTYTPASAGNFDVIVKNSIANKLTLYSDSSLLLPVTLLDFTAIKYGKANLLQWRTTNEINSSHFNIQRSSNGFDFSSIGQVYANNRINGPNKYQFTDAAPVTGTDYYRLEVVDKDGYTEYSNVRVLKDEATASFIYPVPAKNVLTVETNGKAQFSLLDQSGRILFTTTINSKGTIDVSRLNAGTYFLRNNSTGHAQKVVIAR